MATPTPLSSDLRCLYVALRRQACLGEPMAPGTCRRLALALGRLARKADDIEAQAADAAALEDELFAVAQDLDRVAGEPLQLSPQPSFQAALKAQQRVLQAQLDEAGPVHVPRPGAGLVKLSSAIGDSNVVTFPVIPRLRTAFDDGGDAA